MRKSELSFQPSLPDFEEALGQNEGFYEFLPYSDLRRWVPEKSIYTDAFNAFPLGRLEHVKALSFLSYVRKNPEQHYFIQYNHSRLDHSITVALVTEQILKQSGLPQKEINIGIIAGLLHDIATPAHGDATKNVDPENLDEEKFWWEVLDKKGQDFIAQHEITTQAMDSIIKNKGVLGKTLDVADRITYTMKDLYATAGPSQPSRLNLDPYLLTFRYILSNHPEIGNIYKEVGVNRKNQEVFFNNPQTLETFLLLRAHLHQALYLHPTNQARDFFVAKLIEPLYSNNDQAPLSPSTLRRITDHELLQVIYDHYKFAFPRAELDYPNLINWYPQYERFDTQNQAEKRRLELSQNDNIAVIGIKRSLGFDPGTAYKVTHGNREIVEFREFNPTGARQIEEIAKSTQGIFLFYADVSQDSVTNTLLRTVLKT